jgi:hypothetical protein
VCPAQEEFCIQNKNLVEGWSMNGDKTNARSSSSKTPGRYEVHLVFV